MGGFTQALYGASRLNLEWQWNILHIGPSLKGAKNVYMLIGGGPYGDMYRALRTTFGRHEELPDWYVRGTTVYALSIRRNPEELMYPPDHPVIYGRIRSIRKHPNAVFHEIRIEPLPTRDAIVGAGYPERKYESPLERLKTALSLAKEWSVIRMDADYPEVRDFLNEYFKYVGKDRWVRKYEPRKIFRHDRVL